jgi:hypothetical protein
VLDPGRRRPSPAAPVPRVSARIVRPPDFATPGEGRALGLDGRRRG